MPITVADFQCDDAPAPRALSERYDPTRPFLFDTMEPRYATTIVRSVFVPMRDGVRLSTQFHIPLGVTLPLPVVLVRTPYGKTNLSNAMPAILPEQGFVYAVQDVRGRNESEGAFVACGANDRDDGFDTVEWLIAQPWCNGSVGTMGSSYTGETAAKLAAMRHPAHKCGVIMFDGANDTANSRNGAYLQGGVTMLRMMFGWFRDHVPKYSMGPPPGIDREAFFSAPWAAAYTTQPVAQPPVDLDAHLLTLPVDDMLDRSGAAPSEFGDMMRRSADPADPYWNAQGFLHEDDTFDTPTIHVTGPLEKGGSGFDNFRLFCANATTDAAREHQYLWFTPAPHSQYASSSGDTQYGARNFGDTRLPYYRMLTDWFGHWLRGDTLDLTTWPKVRYFPANHGAWRTAASWPPEGVATRSLFLHGDGRLSFDAPQGEHSSAGFRYDPADPTPSDPPTAALDGIGGGYADRAEIEAREDVLVYTSDPLAEPVEIAGPVSVDLLVSSSAVDTDFVAVLSEVDDEGRSINVTHGIARMRYRNGIDRPEMMVPERSYRVTIDLWHAAIVFPAGHRIRLSIASSHFPYWDRNLNTGGNNYTDTQWLVADNEVHHDPQTPSRIVLPILDA